MSATTMDNPLQAAGLGASDLMPRRLDDDQQGGMSGDDQGADGLGQPTLEPAANAEPRPLLQDKIAQRIATWLAVKNLANLIKRPELDTLAMQVKRDYDIDENSRADWKAKYRVWMDLAMQVTTPKTYPWSNASNVQFPLLTVAALQFNARAYPAIVVGRNVVKGTVIGDDKGVSALDPATRQPLGQPDQPVWLVQPGAKQARADKIGRHMSWQLLTEMPEWENQTDQLLMALPIVGCLFRKTWYDPSRRRNVSETVSAMRLCVNYHAKSFETAPRYTEELEVYPWEIESNVRSGLWLDYGDEGYGHNQDGERQGDDQAPTTFLEQHRRYDLDGDGYDEPLIVTIARDSGKIARIVCQFDEESITATEDGEIERIEPVCFYTKYGLVPAPDGGVYDIGLGHLMHPLNEAVNTTINQLFDAGHLQIRGGGFIGSGMNMNAGSVKFMMGEFKVVNTPGAQLKDNIVPMVFPGPNPVLLSLLQFLVENAKEVGSIKDILTGDLPGANVPGILGLAVIQQGLKVFNAIFKRVHRSLGRDFQMLFRLNRLYMPAKAGFRWGSEYFDITSRDYAEGGGVEPFSDPNMVTDAQQMAQANFLSQFMQDPFFDGREIRLRMLQAAVVPSIDKLLKAQAPPDATITAKLAELSLEKKLVDLRETELQIRAAHQEADQDIKRGKDKATEIELLARSIEHLANARKADAEADQGWYSAQLETLRQQIEFLNVSAEQSEPTENSPAAVAGTGAAAARAAAGSLSAGVPAMAPPPGQPPGTALPGGLPGPAGPAGA